MAKSVKIQVKRTATVRRTARYSVKHTVRRC